MNLSPKRARILSMWCMCSLVSACLETDPPTPNNMMQPDAGMMADGGAGPTQNRPPVAAPGASRSVRLGEKVSLDGSGSFDPDDDALSYAWSLKRPQDSDVSFVNDASAVAEFTPDVSGTFEVTLVVNDGVVDSAPVSLTITVMAEDTTNLPPVADAGVNRQIELGVPVTLDGGSSSDPEGDALTFAWSIVSAPTGSNAQLTDFETQSPKLTPDVEGMYQIRLIVSDGMLGSNPALLTLTAVPNAPDNQPPVARQSSDQSAEVGAQITLDGSSSQDPDGDTITYQWSLSAPASSNAFLSAPTASSPTFTADVEGIYTAKLTVNDGELTSAESSSTITVSLGNQLPIARVGMARNAIVGEVIELDGSSSSDPDDDTLTFSWALTGKPSGSTTTLAGTSSMMPTFTPDMPGAYIAALTVNDGTVDSMPASVLIDVIEPCILISEYVEGSSNNKAVEFYNCSGATLSLQSIRVCLLRGTDVTCPSSRPLPVAELADGMVSVLCNGAANAEIMAICNNNTSSVASFNGDDRLVLFSDLNGDEAFDPNLDTLLDAFGQYDQVAPSDDAWKDITYERCSPTPYNGTDTFVPEAFFTAEPKDTISNLGVAPVLSGCP